VVAPGEEIKADKLNCMPVNMQCKGKLGQIFEFYRQLQRLDRLVRIESVKLVNSDDLSGQVSMQTRTVVYYRPNVDQG
jgi:Tfp pilus assembly protein PilO